MRAGTYTTYTTPKHLRTLRAEMEMKDLTLREVSKRGRVPYCIASMLLRGKLVRPESLARLAKVITSAHEPQEVRS